MTYIKLSSNDNDGTDTDSYLVVQDNYNDPDFQYEQFIREFNLKHDEDIING